MLDLKVDFIPLYVISKNTILLINNASTFTVLILAAAWIAT